MQPSKSTTVLRQLKNLVRHRPKQVLGGKIVGYTDKFTAKAVQHGLGRKNTGKIQTLWVEIPPYCNLACPYCYACGGEVRNSNEYLTREDYKRILEQAENGGVDSIGIPGAGEPLIGRNLELTMWLLRECAEKRIYITLFTTGEFITPGLAATLFTLPVEVMLKCNTLDPEYQDRFVSNPEKGITIHGYGETRNRAIEVLMAAGFNDPEAAAKHGRQSRMALVTSIMTDDQEGGLSNIDEIPAVYRFCRDRNIIADIDTILKRGRALECTLSAGDKRIMETLRILRLIAIDEYGDEEAALSSTYVETVCDRHHHHLYIDIRGNIRPCIGAMDVDLGNIRTTTLLEAWNREERRIIRKRKFVGPCATCGNFQEKKCNSCLGRRTPELGNKALNNENLLREGAVCTTGCSLYRKGC
jgi:MoaA/NifB/PqqE/SkfB family radical SAM enzyme